MRSQSQPLVDIPTRKHSIALAGLTLVLLCIFHSGTAHGQCETDKLVGSCDDYNFGYSLSLGNSWALVGANYNDPTVGAGYEVTSCPGAHGAAFVFRVNDNGTPGDSGDDYWVEHQRLVPYWDGEGGHDYAFAYSVSLDGERLAIGSPGWGDITWAPSTWQNVTTTELRVIQAMMSGSRTIGYSIRMPCLYRGSERLSR